jgi:hypothetical protein
MPKRGSGRIVWMVAVCGVAAVAAAWFVFSGPVPSQAAAGQFPKRASDACALQAKYTGVGLEEASPGRWVIMVGMLWECLPMCDGVEKATGVLRLTPTDSSDVTGHVLELPCRLNVSVRPGHPLKDTIFVEWDESDEAQRWLRGANLGEVHAEFTADWSTPTPAASDRSAGTQTISKGTAKQTSTGGFHPIGVRSGIAH